MEKYCLEITHRRKSFVITQLFLVLVFTIEPSIADTLNNQCDAQAKLPRHLSHIRFKGEGDNGCNNPIVIENAKNMSEGIAAEKIWIRTCYPSTRVITKALSQSGNKTYEVVEVSQIDNTSKRFCFDITGFFGSW